MRAATVAVLIYIQLVVAVERLDFGIRVNVAEIGGYSRRVDDVEQRQLGDQGRLFKEQRQWLSDATAGSAHGHFYISLRKGKKSLGLKSVNATGPVFIKV